MTDAAISTEPRSAEILDDIKGVFATKGFDGASMQDLARAAGMSAGNFYRYFPSKHAIIEAMVGRDLADVQRDFAAIMEAPNAREALRATILRRLETVGDDAPLWAEIEAASARRSEIGEISERMQKAIVGNLVRVFARISGVPEAVAAQRYAAHALLLIMLVKGTAVTCCTVTGHGAGVPVEALRALILRQIDLLLDEIAAGAAPRPVPEPDR
jgi:AcrR family transcriptional regulator